MSRFKRMLWLGVVGLLAASAFAVPARAQVKGDCALFGTAKTYAKDGFDTPSERKQAVPLTGGSGKYRFDSLEINCLLMEKSAVPTSVDLTVESEGWWEGTICGTGKAFGTSIDVRAQSGGTKDYAAILADEKYKVVFANLFGAFFWHEWNKPKPPFNPPKELGAPDPDPAKQEQQKDWQFAGNVQLSEDPEKPSNLDPGTNECAAGFTVVGVIRVDPRPGE